MTPPVAVRLPSDDSMAKFDTQPKQAPRNPSTHHGLEAEMVDQRYVTESVYPVVGQQRSRSSNSMRLTADMCAED